MTGMHTSTANRLEKQERYRKLMFGTIGLGIAASIVLRALEYPLVGEAIYWLGIIGFLGIWFGTSVSLFDERDARLEQRASQFTLYVAAVVLIVGASGSRVYATVTDQAVPPALEGAIYGYIALFAVFGVAFLWVRYQA